MPHPVMYDEDDPVFRRVRELALALPDADMKVSHGRPAFFTTKVFAHYGGSVRRDGEWVQHARCVLVLLDPSERAALVEEARCFVPAYLGPSGWLGVDLPARPTPADWEEVAELLESSYRMTAGVRRVARLDERLRR